MRIITVVPHPAEQLHTCRNCKTHYAYLPNDVACQSGLGTLDYVRCPTCKEPNFVNYKLIKDEKARPCPAGRGNR